MPSDPNRNKEFFAKLNKLLDEYPDLFDPAEDDETEEDFPCGHSYDKSAVKYRNGIVVIVSYQDINDVSSLCWRQPWEQSAYLTRGMLSTAYRNW